jgi:hypothetical protein
MRLTSWGFGLCLIGTIWCLPQTAVAQQSAATEAASASTDTTANPVPQLLNYAGVLTDLNGKPLTNVTGVTLLLYKDQQGGAPLWMETQNVHPDKAGHYSAMLGSTTSRGVPQDVFVNGEARWLGVQPDGQSEQPRVLLVSVPYALKAADAETVGGASALGLRAGERYGRKWNEHEGRVSVRLDQGCGPELASGGEPDRHGQGRGRLHSHVGYDQGDHRLIDFPEEFADRHQHHGSGGNP